MSDEFQPDGSWVPEPKSPYRRLVREEVEALLEHGATLNPDDVLTQDEDLPDGGFVRRQVTRLQDLHNNWDTQHPLLQEALTARGLHPGGKAE